MFQDILKLFFSELFYLKNHKQNYKTKKSCVFCVGLLQSFVFLFKNIKNNQEKSHARFEREFYDVANLGANKETKKRCEKKTKKNMSLKTNIYKIYKKSYLSMARNGIVFGNIIRNIFLRKGKREEEELRQNLCVSEAKEKHI